MIFKRYILLILLCIFVRSNAVALSNDSDTKSTSYTSLVPLGNAVYNDAESESMYSSFFFKPQFMRAWHYVKPFSTYLINLAFGFGVSYSVYRYAPDKFPWIWAGTSTYTSLILGAAVISYGKENQALKEQVEDLTKEKNALEAEKQKFKPIVSCSSIQEPEVIVVSCKKNLEDKLKRQREKTVAWHTRADELALENLMLKDLHMRYAALQDNYNDVLQCTNQMQKDIATYDVQLTVAESEINKLKKYNSDLLAKMLELQNRFNKEVYNKQQLQYARGIVSPKNGLKNMPATISVKA